MDLAAAIRQQRDDQPAYRIGTATAAAAGGVISVNVDGAVNVYPVLRGLGIIAGESVLVLRRGASSGIVVGSLGAPVVTPPPPVGMEPPAAGTQLRTVTLLPTRTGTWQGSNGQYRTTDDNAWQGQTMSTPSDGLFGMVDFGGQLKALGADTAQAHSASVHYLRLPGGGLDPDTALPPRAYPLLTWDSGASPGFAQPQWDQSQGVVELVTVKADQSATTQLPQALVTRLLTDAVGLAFQGSGNSAETGAIVLAGHTAYARAFALTITYYA